ncbi:hypothetical protein ACKLTP_18980, partial [Paenarthrobacter ureafaciens]
ILGALVGTLAVTMSAGDVEIVGSLDALLQPWTLIIVGIFCLGVAASNAMNLYCGVLCALTIWQTFKPTWLDSGGGGSHEGQVVIHVRVG